MREKYDPPKMEATSANILIFIENQILLHEAILAARRSTNRDRDQDTQNLIQLVDELRTMKKKAQAIFYDPDPLDRPERPARKKVRVI